MLGDPGNISPAKISLISDDVVLPDGSEEADVSVHENADEVGAYVNRQFQVAHDARRNAQEDILLQAERAYRNKYSSAEVTELKIRAKESEESTVFVP